MSQETTRETVLVERDGHVATITLNRPKALNALDGQVMAEAATAAAEFDADPGIGAIVITGLEKSFTAGADVKEMAGYVNRALETTLADDLLDERSTAPLRARDRRSKRRHGRVHREAPAKLHTPIEGHHHHG
jgi:enoyl-CoA hydratase/carnithine racemase